MSQDLDCCRSDSIIESETSSNLVFEDSIPEKANCKCSEDKDCSPNKLESKDSEMNKERTSDYYSPGECDVATEKGRDFEEEALQEAIDTANTAGSGGQIPVGVASNRRGLDMRIQDADFEDMSIEPHQVPLDQDPPGNEPPFQEIPEDITEDFEDDTATLEGEPEFTPQVEPPQTVIQDPNQWIMNALTTIHSDIQLMKPHIGDIPVVKKRVDEIQVVLGVVTSGFIEMKNAMTNMEAMVAKNRIDIAKLTDYIQTLTPPTVPIIISKPAPSVDTTLPERNLTKLIVNLSQSCGLGPDQETILRNVLMSHDRELISDTLKGMKIIRPLMSSELDKLVNLDTGSSKSMGEVLRLLQGLFPAPGPSALSCPAACTPPFQAPPKSKPALPFKRNKN